MMAMTVLVRDLQRPMWIISLVKYSFDLIPKSQVSHRKSANVTSACKCEENWVFDLIIYN